MGALGLPFNNLAIFGDRFMARHTTAILLPAWHNILCDSPMLPVNKDDIIPLEYTDESLPEAVRKWRPILYKDEAAVCCILGSDPMEGIFGCGDTPDAAIKDWNEHFKEFVNKPGNEEMLPQLVSNQQPSTTKE